MSSNIIQYLDSGSGILNYIYDEIVQIQNCKNEKKQKALFVSFSDFVIVEPA